MNKTLVLFLVVVLAGGIAASAEKDEVAVTFTFLGPNAKTVGVAGEFSNWKILPLTRDTAGVWKKVVYLKPGRYGYKLVVDDEWIFDPTNPDRKMVNNIENSAVTAGAVALPPAEPTVAVEFKYTDPAAKTVHLAGDFNQWLDNELGKVTGHENWQMQNDGAGNWTLARPMKPGRYVFKYVVDGGARWVTDPNLPTADDGNSVLVVSPVEGAVAETAAAAPEIEVPFELDAPDAKAVSLAGEFNQWSTNTHALAKTESGKWRATLHLKPGRHAYKFVVDGQWKPDPANPETAPDGFGGVNSVKIVGP